MTTASTVELRRAPWVVVHPPMEEGAPWIVERAGESPLRVSRDIGQLLTALDGDRDADELASTLGGAWTPELVTTAVDTLRPLGVLAAPDAVPPPPERRFVARSMVMIQMRLVRADRLLAPVRPFLERLSGGTVLAAAGLAAVAGLLALLLSPGLPEVLGRPLPIGAALVVWSGLAAVTLVHELGHGATLTHYRGRPGWFGVMLFYMTPACFCEVTDGWRLARPRQRVMVALAGVITQAAVGGVVALVATMALPAGDARTTAIALALAIYAAAVVNLAPWVKMDGYLALMSHLDLPNLRDRAMDDARGWVAQRVFGIRRPPARLGHRGWAVPYGLLCIAFPVVLLTLVMHRWGRELTNMGWTGAALKLTLLGVLAWWLGGKAWRALRTARGAGVSLARCALVVLAVAGVGAAVGAVPVHDDVRVGYLRQDGGLALAVPAGGRADLLVPGSTVTLQRRGLLLRTDLGSAEIAPGPAVPGTVPAEALIPFRADAPIEATVLPLRDVRAAATDGAGTATVRGPQVPLATKLMHDEITSSVRAVLDGWNDGGTT